MLNYKHHLEKENQKPQTHGKIIRETKLITATFHTLDKERSHLVRRKAAGAIPHKSEAGRNRSASLFPPARPFD
jgi:hypothetical protein